MLCYDEKDAYYDNIKYRLYNQPKTTVQRQPLPNHLYNCNVEATPCSCFLHRHAINYNDIDFKDR